MTCTSFKGRLFDVTCGVRWDGATFDEFVTHPDLPLGYNFEQNRVIISRQIHYFFQIRSALLKEKFLEGRSQMNDSFFGRQITLRHQDRLLCLMVEVVPENLLQATPSPPSLTSHTCHSLSHQ